MAISNMSVRDLIKDLGAFGHPAKSLAASLIVAEISRRLARIECYRGTQAGEINNILNTGNAEGHVLAVAPMSEASKRALDAPTTDT